MRPCRLYDSIHAIKAFAEHPGASSGTAEEMQVQLKSSEAGLSAQHAVLLLNIQRRPKRFAEVWIVALCATAMLYAAEHLFVVYLKDFATLNAVYGAFGGIMALLLWIYLFGCIFIFGACLCAAQAE